MAYRYVLLDVGGTLWVPTGQPFDARLAHIEKLKQSFDDSTSEALVRDVSHRCDTDHHRVRTRAVLEEILKAHCLPAGPNSVEELRRCFVHSPRGRRKLAAGANDFLARALRHNVKVALVANAFARTGDEYLKDLQNLGLRDDALRAIVLSQSSADCGWRKPSQMPLFAAMRYLGANRDQTIMVGDSTEVDGLAAARSGIAFRLTDGRNENLDGVLSELVFGHSCQDSYSQQHSTGHGRRGDTGHAPAPK